MKSCHNDGDYVLWKSKRDPAFACEKHLGAVTAAMIRGGDRMKPVQVAVANSDDAPCLYSEMCESK